MMMVFVSALRPNWRLRDAEGPLRRQTDRQTSRANYGSGVAIKCNCIHMNVLSDELPPQSHSSSATVRPSDAVREGWSLARLFVAAFEAQRAVPPLH